MLRACQRRGGWFKAGISSFLAPFLLLGTVGCTTFKDYVTNGFKVGPEYHRPPAPVAEDWIDAGDVRIRKESEDLSRWWTVFGDPALDSLVGAAYAQNISLREAGFRVLAARARLGIAVGNFFPQQQYADGGYSRVGLSTAVANRQFIADSFYDQWAMGFNLGWELDFWGRFRRAIQAADRDLDASIESYDDVLVTLLGDLAVNYTRLRTLERQIELARANVALQKETLTIARAKFTGGTATQLDVDQAQSLLSQTEATIPQLEITLRQVNNALCVLLGIAPEDLRKLLGPGPIPAAPPSVAVGIPAQLLTRRPDIRRAEREAAAQSARIGIAVADLYPHISITGSFGYSAQQFAELFGGNAFRGTIGPAFQWNLLNYGRLINRVRLEDALFEELVARYQNTVVQAGAEVENGLITFLKAHETTRNLAESVTAARQAVDVSIAQYKGGLVDFNRVAFLEQNLVQQQNLLAQAQGQIAQGLIETYRALGGGWEIRLDPPVHAGLVTISTHKEESPRLAPLPPQPDDSKAAPAVPPPRVEIPSLPLAAPLPVALSRPPAAVIRTSALTPRPAHFEPSDVTAIGPEAESAEFVPPTKPASIWAPRWKMSVEATDALEDGRPSSRSIDRPREAAPARIGVLP